MPRDARERLVLLLCLSQLILGGLQLLERRLDLLEELIDRRHVDDGELRMGGRRHAEQREDAR